MTSENYAIGLTGSNGMKLVCSLHYTTHNCYKRINNHSKKRLHFGLYRFIFIRFGNIKLHKWEYWKYWIALKYTISNIFYVHTLPLSVSFSLKKIRTYSSFIENKNFLENKTYSEREIDRATRMCSTLYQLFF